MSQRMRGLLCSIGASATWGLSGACVQCLTSQYGMGGIELTSIRMVVAGLLLLMFLAVSRKGLHTQQLRRPKMLLQLAVFGIVGVFASQFTYIMAIASTNAGTATVFCCLNSVLLLGFVCLTKRRAPHPAEAVGIVLALGSVWLMATGGNPSSMAISPAGLIWGIGCAAAVAFYTVFSKPVMGTIGSLPAVAWGMLFGGLASTGIALPQWQMPTMDAAGWLLLAVVVVLGTAVTFALFFRAVVYLEPVEVGVLSVIEPLVATVLSTVWLHTAFHQMDLVAFAMMFAMVMVVAVAGSKPSSDARRASASATPAAVAARSARGTAGRGVHLGLGAAYARRPHIGLASPVLTVPMPHRTHRRSIERGMLL